MKLLSHRVGGVWLVGCGVVAALGVVGCSAGPAQRFHKHIAFLASDDLKGRGVGTPEIERAADYIAAQFALVGLQPAGENGTYFQSFPIALHRKLTDQSRLTISTESSPLELNHDFVPLSFSAPGSFDGDVVFCGYGIQAAEKDRDDYVHADVHGKVALMFRGEPPAWTAADGTTTKYATFWEKAYGARDRGAVAILVVNQAPGEGEADRLMEFEGENPDDYGIPAIQVSRAMVERMLASGGAATLAQLQNKLDAGSYASAVLKGVRASGDAGLERTSAKTRNVLALRPGSGAMAEQVVVVGAHYDHLGVRKPSMRTFRAGKLVTDNGQPQIHNGADDNASGVSGLFEIARELHGKTLNRSVLFIAFSAEESGLHGSKHYVSQPTVAIEKMVAMLNLDMIGRLPTNSRSVQVFGTKTGSTFEEMLNPAASRAGLTVAATPDAGGRSDHASFARAKVPVLHFFSGQHSDYHKPSDDTNKINRTGGVRIIKLVADLTEQLANTAEKPAYVEVKSAAPEASGPQPSFRVVMGLAPGYGDDGKPGMLVEAVNADGPADLGGMKAGDRILRIGDTKVSNIYDYMASTRKNKAGDVVEVVVQRGDKEMTLTVTLSAAK